MKIILKFQLALVIVLAICLISCNKKDEVSKPEIKSDTQTLLTANNWKIIERANDDNKNGKIDENEFTQVSDQEKASIVFLPTGEGINKGIFNSGFKWSLKDQENINYTDNLIKSLNILHIEKLTEKEFNVIGQDVNNKSFFGFNCIAE